MNAVVEQPAVDDAFVDLGSDGDGSEPRRSRSGDSDSDSEYEAYLSEYSADGIRHVGSFDSVNSEAESAFGDGGAVMSYTAYRAERLWLRRSYDDGYSHRPPEMMEYRQELRKALLKSEKVWGLEM